MITSDQVELTLKNAADHLARNDSILRPIIARSPLPALAPHTNYYQSLVTSIISQQLSVKAASAIAKRFIASFPGGAFPMPDTLLNTSVEQLRSLGLSRQKASYLHDLAQKVADGTINFELLDALDNQAVVDELTKVKGIGEWTVHMFLMFCMGRLDVLPVGDLGIKNGIKTLYGLETLPSAEVIRVVALQHQWHPYESAASWYVWRSLENTPGLADELVDDTASIKRKTK